MTEVPVSSGGGGKESESVKVADVSALNIARCVIGSEVADLEIKNTNDPIDST